MKTHLKLILCLVVVLLVEMSLAGCGGGGGDDTNPAPTVQLTADQTTLNPGQSTSLHWTSTNATSVVSSNFGAASVDGDSSVSPTSTITVEGPGGQDSDSVTVTVGGGQPRQDCLRQ